MVKHFIGFILIVLWTQVLSFSQDIVPVEVDLSCTDDCDFTSDIYVLEDTSKQFTINNVVGQLSAFRKYESDKTLNKKSAYWAYLSIRNSDSIQLKRILQIGRKRHSDFSEMYVFQNGKLIQHTLSGHYQLGDKKDIIEERGSKFYIDLSAKTEYEIYFRIENISNFAPAFEIKILHLASFYKKVARRNMQYGILQGVLLIMFLYHIFIYLNSRKRIYIFYSLYVFGMYFNITSERGFIQELLISGIPELNPYIFVLSTGIAAAFYFLFIREFLDSKENMPNWDKVFIIIVYVNILVTVFLISLLLFNYNVSLVVNISNGLNMLVLVIGVSYLVYFLRYPNKLARYFIAGTLLLSTGTFISIYLLSTSAQTFFEPQLYMSIGVIGQILLFSLGLGSKIQMDEVEKIEMQENLINQLKTNEELKDRVNKELEDKVRERTVEIEAKNLQMEEYSVGLEESNNLLISQNEEINQKKEEIQSIADDLQQVNAELDEQKSLLEYQHSELERVNKTTMDSIMAGERIQTAMLPGLDVFESNLSDSFVYFHPRDIVSGDFYWAKKTQEHIIIVAADCTGHGVPGAFVSLLGISFLNEIVVKSGITKASIVLEELRDRVKGSLNQTKIEANQKDGMDLSLVVIDLKTKKLQYSGAYNPLYYLPAKNNYEELVIIKADRQPIGIYRKEKPFTNHEFTLEKNDRLYLFTDGFIDQFSGENAKKYTIRRFKELILSIQNVKMSDQKLRINQTYENWRGERDQLDDMLILGLEI